uniref:Uncharacterized protein n=1 Tax=Graphocephala atropunctata TaxID=36148 RepID=A0A1B6LGF5_9HEMI
MLSICLMSLLLVQLQLQPASATLFDITQAVQPLLSLIGLAPRPNCGPCPPRDCRLIPAIVLGYCCGCALPIDQVPIVCPASLVCPPLSPRLCGDYNYLMDCCC